MDGDQIIMAAVVTSLNNMFKRGWVDICCIQDCASLMEVNPEGKSYEVLETLHCIYFKDMTPALVKEIPALVNEILFDNPTPTLRVGEVEAKVEVEITLQGVKPKNKLPWYRKNVLTN